MTWLADNAIWFTYLLTRVDVFKEMCIVVIVLGIIGTIVTYAISDIYRLYEDVVRKVTRIRWVLIVLVILSAFTNLLLPSSKDIALIAGVALGSKAIVDISDSSVGKKAYKLIEKKLDETLEEKK